MQKIVRHWGLQSKHLSADWMLQRELPRMQAQATIWPPAAPNIANNRMTDR